MIIQLMLEEKIEKLRRKWRLLIVSLIFCYIFMYNIVQFDYADTPDAQKKALRYVCIALTSVGSILLLVFIQQFYKANNDFLYSSYTKFEVNSKFMKCLVFILSILFAFHVLRLLKELA
jgi:F0F1-type ATP synthase membrane subunit a